MRIKGFSDLARGLGGIKVDSGRIQGGSGDLRGFGAYKMHKPAKLFE